MSNICCLNEYITDLRLPFNIYESASDQTIRHENIQQENIDLLSAIKLEIYHIIICTYEQKQVNTGERREKEHISIMEIQGANKKRIRIGAFILNFQVKYT